MTLMKIAAGGEYDVVSPHELKVSLDDHHSKVLDAFTRGAVAGIKTISPRWSCIPGRDYSYTVNEGFIMSLLYVSAGLLTGAGAATLNIFITDDPMNPQMQEGVASIIQGNQASPATPFSAPLGALLIRSGQSLLIRNITATSGSAGQFTAVMLPAEMIGKLYV